MQRGKRILLGVGCVALLIISWLVAVTAKTDTQKQIELINQATAYIDDEIYILAAPLLEEAIEYDGTYTLEAEENLKDVYLHLLGQSGYRRKYTNLLERQMARDDAAPEIFLEAAQYYLDLSKESEAFSILRDGIARTGSAELVQLYEETRYAYTISRVFYQNVTALYNGAIQVEQDGYWGLATAGGNLVIPCEYDWISTYSDGQAIVRKGDVISAVDSSNNRVALLHGEALNFGNYSDNRLGIQTEDGWILATGTFTTGSIVFDALGMYTDGYAAAQIDGKWGVIDTSGSEWLIPAEYDGVIQDELGRCFAQGAVFVVKNGQVLLLVGGERVGDVYEDARPFADGWAAVKKDGKWGFIDTAGIVQIDYQFDDALSFGQHLAAVKQGDYWGYISLRGELAIEPAFLGAKSFSGGIAPVQTDKGWQFLTLLEYA